MTPTSSTNALHLFEDATLIDIAEASDNTSTSPGSSFSNSSDDHVHISRVPGEPCGRQNMNERPLFLSQPGIGPSCTHGPSTTSDSLAGVWGQSSSFATKFLTGGLMDQAGQWGDLDASLFISGLEQAVTYPSFDTDPSSDVNTSTNVALRGLNDITHFWFSNANKHVFVHNLDESEHASATQPPPRTRLSSVAATSVEGPLQHAFPGTMPGGHGQRDHHLDLPLAMPHTFSELARQDNKRRIPRVETARLGNVSMFSSPNFTPVTASMTGMHQKQSIEDYVAHNVVRWDRDNSIDIWLTCGYGPALRWRLYEFQPKDDEPCWQFQYLQDPVTHQQIQIKKYSPPFGLMKLEASDNAHFDGYLEQLLNPQHLADFGWTCFEEETQVDDFQARLLQAICDLVTGTRDNEVT
ncbi:hypothetical protein LTR49_028159 [Elasticomyces elasticus]|nr:hypothetical protein LTR49_028159 [Elasticomyces elasticus]